MSDISKILKGLADAGGSFGMHNGNYLRVPSFDGVLDRFGIYGSAPFTIHTDEFSTDTVDDVTHSCTENAVDTNHHLIIRLYQIDKAGFHSGAACTGNWYGHGIFRLKQVPEELLGFVHY
jgi:hypothetical protein